MSKKTIRDVNLNDKTVLIRVDFNVPIENGLITNDNRIVEALPTIKYALDNNAKIVLISHLGRIKTQEDLKKNSLRVVAQRLAQLLDRDVMFIDETRGSVVDNAVANMKNGDIIMLENTRFEDLDGKKESKCDDELGKYWASLADVFVNDAFGTAHRAHASNVGVSKYAKESVAGFLLEKEIKFIGNTLENPQRPFVAILGGAKVGDKIEVIKNLLKLADYVLIGGGMSYTFYKALGYEVGTSLLESDKVVLAKELMELGKDKLVLGLDVVTSKEFDKDSDKETHLINEIPSDQMGMDIGPKTIEKFNDILSSAKTVVWNGPVGVFEFERFAVGTKAVATKLASLKEQATTIIGGGDSAAAVFKFGLENEFTHISTGGGASLEYLEGKLLPGIESVDDLWLILGRKLELLGLAMD